jgi:hypothetical protein
MLGMKRLLLFSVVVAASVTGLAPSATAASVPSGERIIGGHSGHGGAVIEPVYDDMTGAIRYVSTPTRTPDPVKSNPKAAAPFYLPVYPVGAEVGALLCNHMPENCPDHGGPVAELAEGIMPGVYGEGVLGHDHLMAGPASHGDFNVAWVPVLILFTSKEAANTHITLLSQIEEMLERHEVIEVPLDGTNELPNLTFHCSVVSAAVYRHADPFLG